MNFEFSDDMQMLGAQAERLFAERDATAKARAVLDGRQLFDEALWQEMVALGWAGATIPEEYGGAGFGPQAACILAEWLGQSLAAVPYSSSVCHAAEAILRTGTVQQKQEYLPLIASGRRIATFAGAPLLRGSGRCPTVRNNTVTADDLLVADAMIADLLVLAAVDGGGETGLYLVDLGQTGVRRTGCTTIDPTRNHGLLSFERAEAVLLGGGGIARHALDRLLARMVIPLAFEQLGVASACLKMARDYACERHAFGRPIGSFQAIKHKLARMFILNELARSNASYGAWAVSVETPELVEVAATARLSGLRASQFATRETLQTFGGMGMTWEADVHLYLRRAKLLAASHGAEPVWSDRLISQIQPRYA